MTLYRVFPREPRPSADQLGHPLFWPRAFQGHGRHDNPDLYGCMYVSESAVAPVAEALAPFRGAGELADEMLMRGGSPLALATLSLSDESPLVDLDDPALLAAEALRPSEVATRERARTQVQAARLYGTHADAAGLRWWSSLESLWINVTLFDRASAGLAVESVDFLELGSEPVAEAAFHLGLSVR
ncbi:MAG: RES domain-containing protein [Actinomycetota bacterium]|nr:RES domain-containing protein [Actinomycetota bacterium]